MTATDKNQDRILVRLAGVSQELTVGIGAAIASVRTLTDVSLQIRSRELVVVAGGRGGGERAVLAVIAGDERGVSGMREVHANARLRAMRISASSALALAQEWQRAAVHAPTECTGAGVHEVFLLDVVPAATDHSAEHSSPAVAKLGSGRRWRQRVAEASPAEPRSWNEDNRASLAKWARVCQQRGGAILMATDEQFGLSLIRAGMARESRTDASADHRSSVRETPRWLPSLRVVAMHCGRLAASVRMPLRNRSLAS